MEQDKCPVCLDVVNKNNCLNDICLTCRKIMCKSCLKPLDNCPHCRDEIFQGSIKDIKRCEEILEKYKEYDHTHMVYYILAGIYNDIGDTDSCMKYMKISADMGFSCALNNMAMENKDNEEYSKYLNQGVEKGCLTAIFNKARDEFKKGNYSLHKELITKAAENGLPMAQYTMGIYLMDGEFFEKDFLKGLEYIEKSADNGNINASFELSNIYYIGHEDILEPDKKKAIKYATFAARNGHEIARFNLGVECFYNKFYYEAFKWLKPLVDDDNKSAKLIIGKSYIEMAELMGDFMLKEGVDIITKLADEKDPASLYELGLIYLKGNEIIEKNEKKSFNLIKSASELNYISSYDQLANMYMNGIGTDVDTRLASKYAFGALMNVSVGNLVFSEAITI